MTRPTSGSARARARRLNRALAIAPIAARPWPATSPIPRPTVPSGRGTTAYQSPPTTVERAGWYRAAISTPAIVGSRAGSSVVCSRSTMS